MNRLEPPSLERRELGSDEQVVARILGGEADLFEVIMRRNNTRLYRAARSILRSDDEAEDVMQDAYVRAYTHLGDFRGGAAFSTWLTRIAVHEALARLRRRKKNVSIEDEFGTEDEIMAVEHRSPEQRTHDRELRGALEEAIDALPVAFRTVFVLRSVEEMSIADTAATLGIPEDTVKTRLHRARRLLQESLVERLEAATRGAFAFERPRCDRIIGGVLERIRTQ
ncbi:RNA polymerase sigma factor [Pendulispora rubella]|uniref:RNA polymerase sigma factor n=1 Tax=Pendulispora rubella TaxID=2741070 RepID=A0ABZ2LE30_9BACT